MFNLWILAVITLGLSVLSWRLLGHRRTWIQRLFAVVGLTSLVPMVLLATVWPSLHTILGALALPGIGMLMVAVAAPNYLGSVVLRTLAISALVLGVASYTSQAVWMSRCHTIHFVVPDNFSGEIKLIQDSGSGVDLDTIDYTVVVPDSGIVHIRDDDFMFRCYSTEARYESGRTASLESRGVTSGSLQGNVHGIGPNFEGNIHVWFVEAH